MEETYLDALIVLCLLGCSMNAGHRVKSVSMGKYTSEEIKALEACGNEVMSLSAQIGTRRPQLQAKGMSLLSVSVTIV
jgi:hypothetical protein